MPCFPFRPTIAHLNGHHPSTQITQAQIIHHIFHLANFVLYAIVPPAQRVVFEVENLKASVQILDELADDERALIVAESDGVAGQACLFNNVSCSPFV